MNKVVLLLASFGALGLAASQSVAEGFSYGAYVDYDYDTNTEEDFTTYGAYGQYDTAAGVYAGLEVYNIDDDDNEYEVDVWVGYGGDIKDFSYAVEYYRYYLDETGYDSQELYMEFGYAVIDGIDLTSSASTDLDGSLSLGQDFDFALPAGFDFGVGVDVTADDSEVDWDADLSKSLTDTISVTFGVDGSNEVDPTYSLELAFDT